MTIDRGAQSLALMLNLPSAVTLCSPPLVRVFWQVAGARRCPDLSSRWFWPWFNIAALMHVDDCRNGSRGIEGARDLADSAGEVEPPSAPSSTVPRPISSTSHLATLHLHERARRRFTCTYARHATTSHAVQHAPTIALSRDVARGTTSPIMLGRTASQKLENSALGAQHLLASWR